MATKKINLVVTRYYTKQTELEIEVDENSTKEDIETLISNSESINNEIEEGLGNASLNGDETTWEFSGVGIETSIGKL